jgi:hypothetical protein
MPAAPCAIFVTSSNSPWSKTVRMVLGAIFVTPAAVE